MKPRGSPPSGGARKQATDDREADREQEEPSVHWRAENDVGAAGGDVPLAEGAEAGAGLRLDGRLQPRADPVDDRGAGDPDRGPEESAEYSLHERLAGDLPDDESLAPAERLERAELARALLDAREGQ